LILSVFSHTLCDLTKVAFMFHAFETQPGQPLHAKPNIHTINCACKHLEKENGLENFRVSESVARRAPGPQFVLLIVIIMASWRLSDLLNISPPRVFSQYLH